MKRLGRKLHSQSGAALLLAFLMLLLCIMVASSILAAAASNAGRIKSNRTEQQKYMTLTSAVQLICDDLEKASYTAEYEKYEWKAAGASGGEGTGGGDEADSGGTGGGDEADSGGTGGSDEADSGGTGDGDEADAEQQYFHIKQISGDYSGNKLNGQIPLGKWLNNTFFGGVGYQALADSTDDTYQCDLKVTLPDGLKGYPYKDEGSPQASYQVDKTVTVQVKINPATHNITLTAWLGEGDYDPNEAVKVTAELGAMKEPSPFINPHGSGSALPDLDSTVSDNTLPTPGDTNQTATVTLEGGTTATFTTIKKETLTSMTWKLNWIKKGE